MDTKNADILSCRMCIDGHALHAVNTAGKVKDQCIFDSCPPQHRIIKNWNGIIYCKRCSIKNCNQCDLVSFQAANQTVREVEICTECNGGYVLSGKKDKCVDRKSYMKAAEPALPANKTFNFILEADKGQISPQNLTWLQLQTIKEEERAERFPYIQQALSYIYKEASKYAEVTATIWLAKGDHFLFSCDELIEEPK